MKMFALIAVVFCAVVALSLVETEAGCRNGSCSYARSRTVVRGYAGYSRAHASCASASRASVRRAARSCSGF